MTSQYFESICTTCYLNCLQLLYGYKITHFLLKKKEKRKRAEEIKPRSNKNGGEWERFHELQMTNLKIYRRMHVPWPWFVYTGLIVFILRRSWPHERKTQHFAFKNKRQSWCACPFDSQTLGGACATTKCAPSAFS